MTTDRSDGMNRRTVLKRAVAGTVGTAALGGKSGAADASRLDERPLSRAEADAAFDEYAGELFDLLAEEGLLASGLDELPTGRQVGVGDLVADPEGTAYLAWDDRPDVVRSVTHVEDGVLKVSVEPETGTANAVFVPEDENVQYLYDPEQGYAGVERRRVSTSADCWCEDILCDDPYSGVAYTEFCCDDSGCWTAGCC